MLESASQALVREIQEALDVQAQVDRLLWVVENFFSLGGRRYHELGLYFAVQLPRSVPMDREFSARDSRAELVMRWLPMSDLADTPIQPSFLRTVLAAPPETPYHIVHYDAGWRRSQETWRAR